MSLLCILCSLGETIGLIMTAHQKAQKPALLHVEGGPVDEGPHILLSVFRL